MTEIPQFHTHSQTSTQTQTRTQTQTQTETQTETEPERQAQVKSSQVATDAHSLFFFFFCIQICVLWVFICMRTYLGFKISDRFVLTFTHFSSAAYDGICRFYVDRQTLRRIRRRPNLIVVNCKLEMYFICIE